MAHLEFGWPKGTVNRTEHCGPSLMIVFFSTCLGEEQIVKFLVLLNNACVVTMEYSNNGTESVSWPLKSTGSWGIESNRRISGSDSDGIESFVVYVLKRLKQKKQVSEILWLFFCSYGKSCKYFRHSKTSAASHWRWTQHTRRTTRLVKLEALLRWQLSQQKVSN